MFHPAHFRRAVLRTLRRLSPPTGRHRQPDPLPRPLLRRTEPVAAVTVLRAEPVAIGADDLPLVCPYVLSPEEWALRRAELPSLGAAA